MSLPEALERAAAEFPAVEDALRDANGDPDRLLETLDETAAREVLAWLLGHEVAAAEELVLAWCEAPEGAGRLQGVDEASLAKAGRKVLRKARHRLRSRGIEVSSPTAAPVVARLPEIDESIEMALLSPLDPRGSRMGYLVESHPAGGARLFEALVDDAAGVLDFRAYETGRSRARRFVRELSAGTGRSMLEVEPATFRAVLARAAAHQAKDRPEPRGFTEHRSQLDLSSAGKTPADQVVASLGEGDAGDAERIERVAKRIRSGEIGPWPPPVETLRAAYEPMRESAGSGLVVSGSAGAERREQLLRGAASDVFDATLQDATATRLRETAFVLVRAEQEEDARDCLAAAAELESAGAGSSVALAFSERWFGPMLDELANAGTSDREGGAGGEDTDEAAGDDAGEREGS